MDLAHVTLDGVTYQTYFTHVRYSSRDGSTLDSKSASKEIKGYAVGAPLTQAQRIAVHNLVERYKESMLSEIELGVSQLNEDMAAALGYYLTTIETVMPDSSISRKTYLHDHPTLEESMVIFLLGAPNAFAWTETGWNDGNPAWEYGLGPQGNMIMQIISAYKIGAELILLSDNTNAESRIMELLAGSLTIRESLAQGGVNLVKNPTFGTSQLVETDGWSSGYTMAVLLDRFKGQTMQQMLNTLQGKTMHDLITYNY